MRVTIKAIFLIFIMSSCQPEGRIFVEHKALSPDLEWLKRDVKEFEIPIDSAEELYTMSISFRYANGYMYDDAKILLREISPSGEERSNTFNLKIKNENGEFLGDPGMDIWDSEHLVGSSIKFKEKGTYTFIVSHEMPQEILHYAMEIGLILDQKEISADKISEG